MAVGHEQVRSRRLRINIGFRTGPTTVSMFTSASTGWRCWSRLAVVPCAVCCVLCWLLKDTPSMLRGAQMRVALLCPHPSSKCASCPRSLLALAPSCHASLGDGRCEV